MSVLIGQFDLMKSYGHVGIFHCKLVAILIGNFPFITVMRTLYVFFFYKNIFAKFYDKNCFILYNNAAFSINTSLISILKYIFEYIL